MGMSSNEVEATDFSPLRDGGNGLETFSKAKTNKTMSSVPQPWWDGFWILLNGQGKGLKRQSAKLRSQMQDGFVGGAELFEG